MGSKNRKGLIKATIESIRKNGFDGEMEIIVVDGGSTDGTCDWLARQKDIFTIVQPNSSFKDKDGIQMLRHSWGEFMNIGFKQAKGKYIVMVSDDLILEKGCLQRGYDEMERRLNQDEKIGAGAFYFREYPRHDYYRVGLLPNDYIALNHGFYLRDALEEVGWLDETNYNFYCADGDIIMRLNLSGWKSIALEGCYAEHLVHKPKRKTKGQGHSPQTKRELDYFNKKYPYPSTKSYLKYQGKRDINVRAFWRYGLSNVLFGYLLRYYDHKYPKDN